MLLLMQSSRKNGFHSVGNFMTGLAVTKVVSLIARASLFGLLLSAMPRFAMSQTAGVGQPPVGTPAAPSNSQSGVAAIPTGAPPVTPTQTALRPVTPAATAKAPITISPGSAYITAHLRADHPLTLEQAIGLALSNNRALAFAAESLFIVQTAGWRNQKPHSCQL